MGEARTGGEDRPGPEAQGARARERGTIEAGGRPFDGKRHPERSKPG